MVCGRPRTALLIWSRKCVWRSWLKVWGISGAEKTRLDFPMQCYASNTRSISQCPPHFTSTVYNSKSRNLCLELRIAFTQNRLPHDRPGRPCFSQYTLTARPPENSQPPGWGAHLGLALQFQPQVSILLKQENESSHRPPPSCASPLGYFWTIAASTSLLPGLALWTAVFLQRSRCLWFTTWTCVRDKEGWQTPAASGHFEAVWFPARAELVSRLALLGPRLWTSGQEEALAGNSIHLGDSMCSNTAPCQAAVQLCDLWYTNWGWMNDWWGSESVKCRLRTVLLHQSLSLVKPSLLLCWYVYTHACISASRLSNYYYVPLTTPAKITESQNVRDWKGPLGII